MNLLVIGDWTIDKNWICGVHRSSISSRTGQMHLRGLNQRDGATEALCGAGATAAVLHRAIDEKGPLNYKITGVGVWHRQDNDLLANMIHCAEYRKLQPSGMYGRDALTDEDKNDNVNLINIADFLNSQDQKKAGTTSIVRVYQYTGSRVDLVARVDWEKTMPKTQQYWIPANTTERVVGAIQDCGPFDAVVVKCLNKKAVSFELIEKLAAIEEIRERPWYISTKSWRSKWLNPIRIPDLKEVNCKLLLIPQMAVNTAKRKKHTTKWINSKGFGTQEALEVIEEYRSNFKSKPVVVVLPSGHRILSIGSGKPENFDKQSDRKFTDDLLIVQNERDTFIKPMAIETPFASIFLGAFIVQDLYYSKEVTDGKMTEPPDTRELLQQSVSITREYVKSENKRVLDPEKWNPIDDEVYFNLSESRIPDGKYDWRYDLTLPEALSRWEMATKGLGIIEKNDDKVIELFRGATEVDDYISLDRNKKTALQRLIIELKEFKNKPRERSTSCMIMAPPGTGKTRLAKRLARAEGYNFLPFNLTHINSREQLLDVFDRISTEQAKNPDSPVLVFIDEINTQLGGDTFYSAFLTPLEDGVYVRAEKIFHIQPCFWIFAGTIPDDDEEEDKDLQERNKWSDFRSRLTLPNIVFDITTPMKKKQTETVYIGVSMLVSSFPDVRWVSDKVLTLFWLLGAIEELRMRQLVQFIRSFNDIQRGRVKARNVNLDWLQMQDIIWANEKDDDIWDKAKGAGIIKDIPETENQTHAERWDELEEIDDIKIEL